MSEFAGLSDSARGLISSPGFLRAVAALVGLLAIFAVARGVRRSLPRLVGDPKVVYRTGRVLSFGAYFAAFVFLTLVFQDRLGNVTTALGLAGAGVAFALQEVIASAAGWFAIVFGRFYANGDRVQLGGIRGDVIDIGVFRTTIMECGEWVAGDLYNGRVVRVANSFVFKEPVFNYSADFPFLWDELRVPIRHGSDHRLAKRILLEIADREVGDYARGAEDAWRRLVERFGIEPMQVRPMVTVAFDDNWITLTLRYAVDLRRRRATQDTLFSALLDAVAASDGGMEIASTTLELVRPRAPGEAQPVRD